MILLALGEDLSGERLGDEGADRGGGLNGVGHRHRGPLAIVDMPLRCRLPAFLPGCRPRDGLVDGHVVHSLHQDGVQTERRVVLLAAAERRERPLHSLEIVGISAGRVDFTHPLGHPLDMTVRGADGAVRAPRRPEPLHTPPGFDGGTRSSPARERALQWCGPGANGRNIIISRFPRSS